MAATGKFTAEQIGLVGRAAVEMEAVTGTAIKTTISQYEKLAESPSEASAKLTQTYHYLTLAVYEQIKALEEQGKQEEAATLAIKTLSDVHEQRTSQMVSQAGAVGRAWLAVVSIYHSVISTLGDLGRQDNAYKISQIDNQISNLKKYREEAGKSFLGGNVVKDTSSQIAALLAQKQAITLEEDLRVSKIKTGEAQNKINSAGIEAEKQNTKDIESLKTSTNLEKEKLRIKTQYMQMHAAGAGKPLEGVTFNEKGEPTGGGNYQAQIDKAIKDNTPKSSGRRERVNDSAQKEALVEQKGLYEEAQRDLKTSLDWAKHLRDVGLFSEKEYINEVYFANLDALKNQKKITEDSLAIARTEHNQTDKQKYLNQLKALNDQESDLKNKNLYATNLLEKKSVDDEKKYNDDLLKIVKDRQQVLNDQVAGVGLSAKEKADLAISTAIYRKYYEDLTKLEKEHADKKLDDDEYASRLAAQKKFLDERLAQEKQSGEELAAAQGDWSKGADAAFKDYMDSAKNVAGQTQSLFTNAFSSMENALATFVTTGKLNFASLATSIIAELAKIAAKQAAVAIFGTLVNMAGSAAMSYGGGTMGGASVGGGESLSGQAGGIWDKGFAKGGAFDAGVQKFANGGAFTNGVVNTPTNFNMGQMGEAGAEAIMPLSRTPDGSLGVKMHGGNSSGGSGETQINVNTTIQISEGQSNSKSSTDGNDATAKAMSDAMVASIKAQILIEMQQGGSIWKLNNKQL